tara:strand:- start:144 stop:248 length:105 start_codon:yes stop_codon:yes gene_type:complete
VVAVVVVEMIIEPEEPEVVEIQRQVLYLHIDLLK